MKNVKCITLIIAFLVTISSIAQADETIRYGYPVLNGQFAMPVVRIDKDENFIRILNTNTATPEDSDYIQCMDPVYYDRPVLIGQKKSLWQFVPKMQAIEVFIHQNGKLTKSMVSFETQTIVARTEIVSDSNQNYLVVFLKSDQKMEAIKLINVSGSQVKINDWIGFAECELCKNADWSSIQEKWFKVIANEKGPILIWNDFSDPPNFHSMFIGVSQFNGTSWSDSLILDLDYADSNQDAVSFDGKIVVSWYSKDPKTKDNKIRICQIAKNLSEIKIWTIDPQDKDGKHIPLDRKKMPFLYQNSPILFVTYHNFDDKSFHLNCLTLNEDKWSSLGEEVVFDYSGSSYITPFFTVNGDLSVLVSSDTSFLAVYREDKWKIVNEINKDWYFLKTVNRVIEVDSEKFLIPYP